MNILATLSILLAVCLLSGCRPEYVTRDGLVYFSYPSENGRIDIPLPDADPKTFVRFKGFEYGRDIKRAYWRGMVVSGAHPDKFVCLGDNYSKDDEHVFWSERKIVGARPDSFLILNGKDLWSRDAKDIFFADLALGVIKPESFKLIDAFWATDGQAYYFIRQFCQVGILPSDFRSTRLINGAYAVDKDLAYFRTKPISGSDPQTFRALNEWYAIDKNSAYFEGSTIEGADLSTFRQEGLYHTAKDKLHTYFLGKVK
jgi:hypothetical protein